MCCVPPCSVTDVGGVADRASAGAGLCSCDLAGEATSAAALDLHQKISEIDVHLSCQPVGHRPLGIDSHDPSRKVRFDRVRRTRHVCISGCEDPCAVCGNVRPLNASKICLVHLVERLRAGGYLLCDSQYANEHMTRFGVVEIPAAEYLSMLEDAVEVRAQWDAIDRAPPERTTG